MFVIDEGSVTGHYCEDENIPNGWGRDVIKSFTPTFFQPPLQLIDYAADTPEDVALSLGKASAVYFSNPSACCDNIRIAAEEVLKSLGVPERSDGNGARLSFKHRIDRLPVERKRANVLFDALRWLGNHKSHAGGGITKEQALEAFEIMELLLEGVFSNRRRELRELAIAINNAKGPKHKLVRIIAITGQDDLGLILLKACQAYVRETTV